MMIDRDDHTARSAARRPQPPISHIQRLLAGMLPADIAALIDSTPANQRMLLWSLVDPEDKPEVLHEIHNDDLRALILSRMDTGEIVSLLEEVEETDDIVDFLQQLPQTVTRQILASLDAQDRRRLEMVMAYPEDTAGGLMNTDIIPIRADITLEVVIRYLRRRREIPSMTDNLFVVNRRDEFIGLLPLSRLLTSDDSLSVREAMDSDVTAIPVTMPDVEVTRLFERRDLVSAPVVDIDGKLVGRITVDDVVDVIREESDHSLLGMAGLQEGTDTFAPVWQATRERAIWLGINLLTCFAAASVIALFSDTIQKIVALAVLMPLVASMGGIAGSQSLTLVIRGMAIGQVHNGNAPWLLSRELGVGFLNGLLWAMVVGTVAHFWFHDNIIGWVIAIALTSNLCIGVLAGVTIPLVLKRMGIDPALAGGVVLTTLTDTLGFFVFLGTATLFYA